MVRRSLPSWFLGLLLGASGLLVPGSPAVAADCLSSSEARSAAAAGQVVPLSQILGEIRAAARGDILPTPELCKAGGRFVYLVKVLSPGGQVTRLTVDAASGAILGN
jgi:uncharacterized membrane protein YkoI